MPLEEDLQEEESRTAPPVWLADHQDIANLLAGFIDKIDKGTRLLTRLTPKTVPSLFDYNRSEYHLIWSLIQLLEKDFNILTIELEKPRPDKEVYDNAKVRFNPEQEERIRCWLNRPKQPAYKQAWHQAVNALDWNDSANTAYILRNPLYYSNNTACEVAARLREVESSLTEPLTLRALSARNFWGDSKFLDNRQEYLESAFPHRSKNILVRPVLVNAYVPENYSSVLFIENQDTFLMLVSQRNILAAKQSALDTMAIIYTAGFRGAATRIRRKTSYAFSLISPSGQATLDRFTAWWERESNEEISTFFWGDLDYSGLAILSSLRSVFMGTTAWRPGYDLMIEHHKNGLSHHISSANKGTQSDNGLTGCLFADEILKPIIDNNDLFLDQEVVTFVELSTVLIKMADRDGS